MRNLTVILCLLALTISASADRKKAVDQANKAAREMHTGNLPKAEKLLREALQEDPSYVKARRMLADTLYLERKFGAASDEYAATLKADEAQRSLDEGGKRQVTMQLGVATAFSGNMAKAKEIFEGAIKEDPDYALYHYNLACTYAEMGDLDAAIMELKAAWERRKNLVEGEQFPDPRQDSSFKRYLNDTRFEEAVRHMVF